MRLLQPLQDDEFSLSEHSSDKIPKYAILSHTWGKENQEVIFQDIKANAGKEKTGYEKLRFCGKQIVFDKLEYFWVDTCCINKTDSTELSAAINSMFRWYRGAEKCYVFLTDVSSLDGNGAPNKDWLSQFKKSRWFTRGWTLQELLAPKSVQFFSTEGVLLGDKHSLVQHIHDVTGISILALEGNPLYQFSPDIKMQWALERVTQKEEDAAYCLMGLFEIHMPLIYGEGREHAFRRLKKKIQSSIYPPSLRKGKKPKQQNFLKSKETLPKSDSRMPFQTHRDPSRRHLIRFHEALVLLYTLGGAKAEQRDTESHIEEDIQSLPLKALRRKFLTDVAYICDYKGDGRTTTAIALEVTPRGSIFWVASSSSPEKMIISFMRSLLAKIAENSGQQKLSSSIAAADVFEFCFEFANPHIETCRSALLASLETCLEELDEAIGNEALELAKWLRSWTRQDGLIALCYFACKHLRSNFMRMLSRFSVNAVGRTEDRAPNPFELCIHQIQQLGRVYLTAANIFSYGQRLPELCNNYWVESIPTPLEASLPPLDLSTNFDSIAVRMHPAASDQLTRRQQALREMDSCTQLFQQFQTNYISREVEPHVHPEIQVLEWFHTGKRSFAGDDPYIACSRPSCICCQLYFRYHHGHFVEPKSDGKICLSWRPHDLDTEDHPMTELQQKTLMNSMVKDIRKDALQHIDKWSTSIIKHPEAMKKTMTHDVLRQPQGRSVGGNACTVSSGKSHDLLSEFFGSAGISTTSVKCAKCILLRFTSNMGVASRGACYDQRRMSLRQTPTEINYMADSSDEEGGISL